LASKFRWLDHIVKTVRCLLGTNMMSSQRGAHSEFALQKGPLWKFLCAITLCALWYTSLVQLPKCSSHKLTTPHPLADRGQFCILVCSPLLCSPELNWTIAIMWHHVIWVKYITKKFLLKTLQYQCTITINALGVVVPSILHYLKLFPNSKTDRMNASFMQAFLVHIRTASICFQIHRSRHSLSHYCSLQDRLKVVLLCQWCAYRECQTDHKTKQWGVKIWLRGGTKRRMKLTWPSTKMLILEITI